jgi:hypothetical protein
MSKAGAKYVAGNSSQVGWFPKLFEIRSIFLWRLLTSEPLNGEPLNQAMET